MFGRVYPRSRRPRPLIPGPVLASLAFHVVLIGIADLSLPVYVSESVTEGIQYFAPLPTRPVEVGGERLAFLEIAGGGDLGLAPVPIEAHGDVRPATGQGPEGVDTTGGSGLQGVASVPEFPDVKLDSVYFPEEVDNPAAYDVRSRAPAYPDSLQRLGIEGFVTVQFIVDTTGRVPDSTIRIIDSTHTEFVRSVRAAFPGMLFRPAEIRGIRIRQLVQQTFSFRMPPKGAPGQDSSRTRPPPPIRTLRLGS